MTLCWSQDPMLALPTLPRQELGDEALPSAGHGLAPGVRMVPGERIEVDGTLIISQGPPDGLEVLACLTGGKTHEALVRLTPGEGAVIKAAALAALGLADGIPAQENSALPARGIPVRLRVAWTDTTGRERVIDASRLVRDRITDQGLPALPWIWTGSRFETIRQADPQGGVISREQFMLDVTKSLAVNYDEPDALMASPFLGAETDNRFEVFGRLCPPVGTAVRLVLSRAELPLTLDLAADGGLSAGGLPVTDEQVRSLLASTYGPGQAPVLRAVAVRTGPEVDRTVDAATRLRLIALAAQAQAWVMPVFVVR
jgi:hypothetical protein